MTEEWRPVVGFEGYYEVSDQGQVRSLDRVVRHGLYGDSRQKGKVLAQTTTPSGHNQLNLTRERKVYRRQVHRLVLETFRGPCPPGHECCHGPGGPGDNRLENLRWGTRSSNTLDQVTEGVHNMSRKTRCKNDHELAGDNLYVAPKTGQRACKTCRSEAKRRYRDRGGQ